MAGFGPMKPASMSPPVSASISAGPALKTEVSSLVSPSALLEAAVGHAEHRGGVRQVAEVAEPQSGRLGTEIGGCRRGAGPHSSLASEDPADVGGRAWRQLADVEDVEELEASEDEPHAVSASIAALSADRTRTGFLRVPWRVWRESMGGVLRGQSPAPGRESGRRGHPHPA